MADEVKALVRDAAKLKDDTVQLQSKVAAVDRAFLSARDKLDIPITVSNKLNDLSSTLGTTSQVLQVISIVPPIRAAASRAKMVLDTFATPVRQAAQVASGFASTVRPLRDAVSQLEARLSQLSSKLNEAAGYEQRLIDGANDADRCVSSLPAGGVKDGLRSTLDRAAGAVDQPVVAADQQLAALLSTINRLEKDIGDIASRLQAMANISGAIDSVTSQLRVLLVPMQAVQSALSYDIRVPYGGYPEVCYEEWLGVKWPYPCGWHTVYFTFSIQQILNGISGVIRPVMDLLESAMNAILNPLLSALHLDFSLPSIPGLPDLAGQLNVIRSAYDDLQQLTSGFVNSINVLNGSLDQVRNLAAPVQQVYNSCRGQH